MAEGRRFFPRFIEEVLGSFTADVLATPLHRGIAKDRPGGVGAALGGLAALAVEGLRKRLVRPELRQATRAFLEIGDASGYRSAPKKAEEHEELSKTRLFVSGFSPETTLSKVAKFFQKAGRVARIGSMKRGEDATISAFVEMSTQEGAEAALKLDGKKFEGKKLVVKRARSKKGERGTTSQSTTAKEKPPQPLMKVSYSALWECHREASEGRAFVPSAQARMTEDEFFDLLGHYLFDERVLPDGTIEIVPAPHIKERADLLEAIARVDRGEFWNRMYALKADGFQQRLRVADEEAAGSLRAWRADNKDWLHS